MKKVAVLLSLISLNALAYGPLPDHNRTPGMINMDVRQGNIQSTICVKGWTKTIRPTATYTNRLKKQQMLDLGLSGKPADYEEDHLISLELGGHPSDPRNLWPQPWDGEWGARKKDVVETRLKSMVCKGLVSLKEAQDAIATDWVAAYKKYVLSAVK